MANSVKSVTIRVSLFSVAAGILLSCARTPTPLSPEDLALLEEVGLTDPIVASRLQPFGGPLERFTGLADSGDPIPAPGVTFPVAAQDVESAIDRLRASLRARGVGVFHVEQNFGFEPDRVLILVGDDAYEFLELVRVDGINFDLEHEDVVRQLRAWDQRYGLDFLGGGLDWVSARLTNLPPDLTAFAEEVYAFCPDVVDQGTETVERLEAEVRSSRALYCWWD